MPFVFLCRVDIIVNGKTELVIGSVVDLILSERHVADGEVIEVTSVGGLKACDSDVCLGVKLFCNSPCDAVQFNAVELTVLHRFGKAAKEVADTHRRLYVPADFDTIENAFSGAKPPKKAYNKGLSRSVFDFESPFCLYSIGV